MHTHLANILTSRHAHPIMRRLAIVNAYAFVACAIAIIVLACA